MPAATIRRITPGLELEGPSVQTIRVRLTAGNDCAGDGPAQPPRPGPAAGARRRRSPPHPCPAAWTDVGSPRSAPGAAPFAREPGPPASLWRGPPSAHAG